MSDKPVPTPPSGGLTEDQVQAVSGGNTCTPEQLVTIAGQLTGAYESLVDFTSHVIERIANSN